MVMGDFNDDPVNYSIQVLENGNKHRDTLRNPMRILFKKRDRKHCSPRPLASV